MAHPLQLAASPSPGGLRHSHISCRAGSPSPQKGCRPGIHCRDPSSYPREVADRGFTTLAAGGAANVSRHCHALMPVDPADKRSEEHTSELQSLMRISYAVFCLQNNKTPTNKDTDDISL